MPSRLIREGINASRAISALPEEAQLFYRTVMLIVDDYGRYECDVDVIRAACFPRQLDRWPPQRIETCIERATEAKTDDGEPLIVRYRVGSKEYLQINNFKQRVQTDSKYPPPPGVVDKPIGKGKHSYPTGNNGTPPISTGENPLPNREVPLSNGEHPLRVRATRTKSESETESESNAESKSNAEKSARGALNGTALAPSLPVDCQKRLRALAADCPDTQDLDRGVREGLQILLGEPNPEETLSLMETNIPLWFDAMRDGSARTKALRFVMIDRDYSHKPTKKRGPPPDKEQIRREQGLAVAKELRRK